MLRALTIKNFKSVVDLTVDLGRFNVFIGENGCGKTNIVEALAMASVASRGVADVESLASRGVRVAPPQLTIAQFVGLAPTSGIEVSATSMAGHVLDVCLRANTSRTSPRWERDPTDQPVAPDPDLIDTGRAPEYYGQLRAWQAHLSQRARVEATIEDFAIYTAITPALRGTDVISRRTPVGLHGEGLDVLIASLSPEDFAELASRSRFISWLDEVVLDRLDEMKFDGHKLGRSTSTLYFRDRFMSERHNLFSAENANEGVLHALFHLALFVSPETPKVFAVDNLETSLNPRLCRMLTRELAGLAKARDKQALVTTHNPAVLDGLNLHDDDQRLFVVSRDDEGRTKVRRITIKPQPEEGARFMLSELWMRGHLGGIPKQF
jgi:energy-coupling factor transporter ATP-binding protein EcfA2